MTRQHSEDKTPVEQKHPHADKTEEQIDDTVEDSFPASDPPATTGGTTKVGHTGPDEERPDSQGKRP